LSTAVKSPNVRVSPSTMTDMLPLFVILPVPPLDHSDEDIFEGGEDFPAVRDRYSVFT
jgi:hypothetical protein